VKYKLIVPISFRSKPTFYHFMKQLQNSEEITLTDIPSEFLKSIYPNYRVIEYLVFISAIRSCFDKKSPEVGNNQHF